MNGKDIKIIVWKYNEKLSEELKNKWYKEIYKSWNNIDNWEVNLNIYNVSINNFKWDNKVYYIPDDVDKLFIIWNNLDREIIKNYFKFHFYNDYDDLTAWTFDNFFEDGLNAAQSELQRRFITAIQQMINYGLLEENNND